MHEILPLRQAFAQNDIVFERCFRAAMQDLISHVGSGSDLSSTQVGEAVSFLLDEKISDAAKAALLKALRAKGETAAEIAAFVQSLLGRAIDPQFDPASLPGPMLDVCGTGGDKMDLFNVSTTSMFVLAAGGAVVVKHGNRAITSKCGGADVLEALGVKIDLPPADLKRCVEKIGVGFLFAPNYHPAFKAVAPVRKMLAAQGITTIFNLLGPLLNPAQPAHQLVGVFSERLLPKFAEALGLLGRKHAWAVHGRNAEGEGVDELSTLGPTLVRKVTAGGVETFTLAPEEFGFPRAEMADLRGGDKSENARILTGILDGTMRGAKRDVVLLNAGAGFVVAELARDLAAGIALAAEQIDSGRALAKLRVLQNFR